MAHNQILIKHLRDKVFRIRYYKSTKQWRMADAERNLFRRWWGYRHLDTHTIMEMMEAQT